MSSTKRATGLVVRPVRFSDDVAAMRGFLEALGLAPRVEAESGGWVDMVAGGGMVAVHDAATSDRGGLPGQTRLSFEADDVDALVTRLKAADFDDATVHDESYGRVLTVSDPLGDVIVVDERSDDLYGYRLHGLDRADRSWRVVPVRFTDEAERYAGFLHALGLTGKPNPGYAAFPARDGAHGYVGVHHVYGDDLPIVPGHGGSCQLTFTTTEDLEDVVARLAASGHRGATITREDFASFLTVTDPDGQDVQVHESLR